MLPGDPLEKKRTYLYLFLQIILIAFPVAAITMGLPGIIKAQTLPDCSAVTYDTDDQGRFLISSLEQLQCMKENLEGNYLLINDVDASDTENWDEGKGFLPVGDNLDRFEGSFDGNNYVITNLAINRPGERYIGLFGYIREAVVRNECPPMPLVRWKVGTVSADSSVRHRVMSSTPMQRGL